MTEKIPPDNSVNANSEFQDNSPSSTSKSSPKRKMVKAELMGAHTHKTTVGVEVHIWMRDGKYIARGRYEKEAFGPTLSSDATLAQSELRRLLTEIESGTFLRPSEARKRPLNTKRIPQHNLRGLCNEFLAEKRKLLGEKTVNTYRNRLAPALDFAERKESLKKWPLASDIDRNFVIECRNFLINRQVTRNGSAGAPLKPMSTRQVINCLETLRTMMKWASRANVRLLPPEFLNPLTQDIIGHPPAKDPLRKAKLPLTHRMELLEKMDDWQFLTLGILLVLPLRFEDVAGLLISDINFQNKTLFLGNRFGGSDYNKGKVNVLMPLPHDLLPLLQICKGKRMEGPLFLKRKIIQSNKNPKFAVKTKEELEELFHQELIKAPTGKITCEQDRKDLLRDLLNRMGSPTSKYVGKQLRAVIGKDLSIRPYDLRGSVTQEMRQSDMRHLELRYLTEHSVSDIINEYSGIEPKKEMTKYYEKIKPLLQAIERRCVEMSSKEISE